MHTVKISIAVVAAAILGAGAYAYIQHAERYPSTDDAYINADVVHVAAQVSGPVTEVYVANQQHVSRDDALFTIDPEPYRLSVDQARARLELAKQGVAENEAAVASAEAEVHNQQVLLNNAQAKRRRNHELLAKHYSSQQSADDAEAGYRSAQATLKLAQAKLAEARQRLGTPGERNQAVQEAQAALKQAQWNLDHTRVTAACDGRVAEKSLHRGDSVAQGTPLFVLVCDNTYTVYANFKETEIGRISAGQPVDVTVDMYPDHHFHGRVESINAASGAAFSLLPPQNATGNWVKVTQRVPVKILITDSVADPELPLRVGTSAVVTVDTTGKSRFASASE